MGKEGQEHLYEARFRALEGAGLYNQGWGYQLGTRYTVWVQHVRTQEFDRSSQLDWKPTGEGRRTAGVHSGSLRGSGLQG